MRTFFSTILLIPCFSFCGIAQQKHILSSPNDSVQAIITLTPVIGWEATFHKTTIVAFSEAGLKLKNKELPKPELVSVKRTSVNTAFMAINYKKDSVRDNYNQITLLFKGGYGLIFRAYNDGIAYRFFTTQSGELFIESEKANFNFENDESCLFPMVRDFRDPGQFIQSFESLYREKKISEISSDTIGFLPVLVKAGELKAILLEADLEDYPGMFLRSHAKGFHGVHAPYPLKEKQGGFLNMTQVVTERADYIARVKGPRNFPWRAVVIARADKDLLNNDMVQRLASPSRIKDVSWIRPGKAAWDWWNDWNISHVDFKAGINTATYRHYIDFASRNRIEYIIMDMGWSHELDVMNISKDIDLAELMGYARSRNVRIILWASWVSIHQKMDEAFSKYSAMGAGGFKIDFMDRDDQPMVASLYEIAKHAADYKLILDFHGMYKPTGLQRTYPNVLNFEGVKGMENVKWTPHDDVPRYDVTIPFVRMVAGPMDYTPGAMRNATQSGFRPNGSLPMSQGTRCHQIAMYIVYESPFEMLSDSPTAYTKEQECTDFICRIPTTFNETQALDGIVGEFVTVARRSGKDWYAGSMSNWTPRDAKVPLSFLGNGTFRAEIFEDGVNADRDASDYRKTTVLVKSTDVITLHLAPGGGWAAHFSPN